MVDGSEGGDPSNERAMPAAIGTRTFSEFVSANRAADAIRARFRSVGPCRFEYVCVDGTYEIEALVGEEELRMSLMTDRRVPVAFRARRVGPGFLRGTKGGRHAVP